MELPDVGNHCNYDECNQLDFLPFLCTNCQQVYCKQHSTTSAHDCKCLNEFFKPINKGPTVNFQCSKEGCNVKSPLELLCTFCKQHFCITHRHHGCLFDDENGARKKQEVDQWKKPKKQFNAIKSAVDKKVEQTLRIAEASPQKQAFALKIRIMKLKNKALGDNKIPTNNRIYFFVHPPSTEPSIEGQPLFTSLEWTVGRTIDLFSKRMKIANKNNEPNEPKLKLFKQTDGKVLASKMDVTINSLVESNTIKNGDTLIMYYVPNDNNGQEEFNMDEDTLMKYQPVSVGL